jgi:uncharacterized CHY-type Zn-finger protein
MQQQLNQEILNQVHKPNQLPSLFLAKLMQLKGKLIDDQTRCIHYQSALDIIAIKFKCCDTYYPCYECHAEEAGHKAQTWSKEEYNTSAILCGNCKTEMSINAYLQSNNQCPSCNANFNPKCSKHYHLYFES